MRKNVSPSREAFLLVPEDLPRAPVCFGVSTPTMPPDMRPLALMDPVQCCWMQNPSYWLDEVTLRDIFTIIPISAKHGVPIRRPATPIP